MSVANPSAHGQARIVTVGEAGELLARGASVIDARGVQPFLESHLPRSQRMDWRDWTEERPGLMHYVFGRPERWGRVPHADAALQRRLQELGLSNEKPVLVVGEPHGWGEEGRIAWNLLFWGAREVALLDGGFHAWAHAGGELESGPAKELPRGDFIVSPQRERLAVLQDVKNALKDGDALILDARDEAEWKGKTVQAQRRGGHLPGARLVPHSEVYASDGRYVDADTLRARVGSVKTGASPITYCVGGVRSALLAFLVEARLGLPARNYAGSIWEYSAQEELPLVDGVSDDARQ